MERRCRKGGDGGRNWWGQRRRGLRNGSGETKGERNLEAESSSQMLFLCPEASHFALGIHLHLHGPLTYGTTRSKANEPHR